MKKRNEIAPGRISAAVVGARVFSPLMMVSCWKYTGTTTILYNGSNVSCIIYIVHHRKKIVPCGPYETCEMHLYSVFHCWYSF